MVREANVPVRVVTLTLMAIAYATCEVAAYLDGHPRPVGVIVGCVLFGLAVLLNFFLHPEKPDDPPSRKLSVLFGFVLAVPVLVEPLIRMVANEGFPLEMQLVNGLRILGLLLAGLSAWTKCRRLAGVVALFLALFSSAMGDQPAIPYLLVAFALTGGLWLILEYQSFGQTTAAVVEGELRERVALRLPYREGLVFGVLALLAAGIAFAGPKRVMLTLGELMPTSGGTGNTDPFARYGVGDGPEEVAGDNAQAAGMVESEKMIEDNKNSLIDAVNDMYGKPHKPNKDQQRMIAAGKVDVIEFHGKLPDNRRPSRDFDTGRKGPKSNKKPESHGARGVFEVEGRTPLHVRLVAYEAYDTGDRKWREGRKPGSRQIETDGNDWMKIDNLREADWYSEDDRHRLKVANLKENLVPTPTHLTRFRINKVDKPDYYEWDYEGVLALAGRNRTPPGVVVTTDCRTLDPQKLDATAFSAVGAPVLVEVPLNERAELERLARAWTEDRPRGWPQIEAVIRKLRSEYTLDRSAVAPADHPSPALWFLNESRRGPDYLFASAAATLLRSIGYPARICLGYYASPDAYDRETDHTPVKVTDLHLWPELLLKDGHWLVLEPTPGYEILPPLLTWREWVNARWQTLVAFAQRNWLGLLGASSFLGLLAWWWRRVWDRVLLLAWRLRPGRTWREVALRAARVMDRRAALAGRTRAPSQSLADWAGRMATPSTPTDSLTQLVGLAEWAAYAPNLPPPVLEADVLPICRRALQDWTFTKFLSIEHGVSE